MLAQIIIIKVVAVVACLALMGIGAIVAKTKNRGGK